MVSDITTQATFGYSSRARNAVDQPISYLMMLALTRPELISLAAGFVDYQTLPGAETGALMQEILSDPAASQAALQYGRTQGLTELRQEAYKHLAKCDGISPDDTSSP